MANTLEPCECGYGTVDEAGLIVLHALDCPKCPVYDAFMENERLMGNRKRQPTLFFTTPRRVSREQFYKLKDQLTKQLPDHRVVILEAGLQVKQMWTGDPEEIAKEFHETYERLAPDFDYETRAASAVDWKDVPEGNRKLMVATVTKLLDDGVIS